MKEVTLEELLEAGCHFGHQVTRHNPKSRDFVFEARDNVHIIDLAKTKEGLDEAAAFVKQLAQKEGSTIIVVGTKRQAQDLVKKHVERIKGAGVDGIYYVTNRWIGGILTNFPEVLKNFKKYKDLGERLKSDEAKARYTKKEVGMWQKERQKLESFYGGIADMEKAPDALFIIDTHLESLAVREAQRTHTTTVGIVDTNADPTVIDYPIPGNDDAAGSLELIVGHIVDAWAEGKTGKEHKESGSKNQESGEEAGTVEKKEVKKTVKKTTKKKAATETVEAIVEEAQIQETEGRATEPSSSNKNKTQRAK